MLSNYTISNFGPGDVQWVQIDGSLNAVYFVCEKMLTNKVYQFVPYDLERSMWSGGRAMKCVLGTTPNVESIDRN